MSNDDYRRISTNIDEYRSGNLTFVALTQPSVPNPILHLGLIMALAPNIWALVLARFVVGFASGFSSVLVPIYLGEHAFRQHHR